MVRAQLLREAFLSQSPALSKSLYKLDFSHLKAKGVGYARHQLARKR